MMDRPEKGMLTEERGEGKTASHPSQESGREMFPMTLKGQALAAKLLRGLFIRFSPGDGSSFVCEGAAGGRQRHPMMSRGSTAAATRRLWDGVTPFGLLPCLLSMAGEFVGKLDLCVALFLLRLGQRARIGPRKGRAFSLSEAEGEEGGE
jgi:hypothetical protein